MDKPEKKIIRCAVYTRKSTNEGLDQEFTSLDAQRESCFNYIASQKNEGWVALPDIYADGGFTGGNMDRPSLQKLLTEIKEGRVDCIVVYKVDRLSRSLLDFSKLLEFFDKNNVTFVSITQAFNTNTSMGRLTLNILLSFAQFEREIISERTKDKMSAARKKGRWIGGKAVLGYDYDRTDKRLVPNPVEAKLVKRIFDTYLREKSLLKTAIVLNKEGYKTKSYKTLSGREIKGHPFKNTRVQYIIRNYAYIGKIHYQGKLYDGLHAPIIDEETFQKARDLLTENRVERDSKKNAKCPGLLTHILRCKPCNARMFHTYGIKNHKKYRYYVCMSAQKTGYANCPTKTINAQSVESSVIESLNRIASQSKDLPILTNDPVWEVLFPQEQRRVMSLLLKQADYDPETKKLGLDLNEDGMKLLSLEIAGNGK
jgi:site-specific DNA recombinase